MAQTAFVFPGPAGPLYITPVRHGRSASPRAGAFSSLGCRHCGARRSPTARPLGSLAAYRYMRLHTYPSSPRSVLMPDGSPIKGFI